MEQLETALERVSTSLAALRYRLAVLIGLLSGGEGRYLVRALDDLEAAVDHLHEVESDRVAVAAQVAARFGLSPTVSLRALADTVVGEERRELLEWRQALLEQMQGVRSSVELATVLAQSGDREVRAWLERFATGHDDMLYGRDGGSRYDPGPPSTFDQRA